MKQADMERLRIKAEVFKALGHPLRLGVVEFLGDGEKCVCEIVDHVGTGMSNISKHLAILKKAGVVADRRDGLNIMYRVTMCCCQDFSLCIERDVIERLENQRSIMVA